MQAVLVDSNVLLDTLNDDPTWGPWSAAALGTAIKASRAVMNPIIYAEISARFETIEALDEVLAGIDLAREAIPFEAAFLAGRIFVAYRRRGGRKLSPLSDYFIGAHAMVAGYTLLTRDPRRYRRDFPKLRLIAPD